MGWIDRDLSKDDTCPDISGSWQWFSGATMMILSNGTFPGGTWTCSSGTYVLKWDKGRTDQFTLSADRKRLEGKNDLGMIVWGVRNTVGPLNALVPSRSVLSGTDQPANALAPQLQMAETLLWDSTKESHRSADFNAYLQKFPNGLFAEVARNRLARITFDGVWSAKMVCPEVPDGAKAYTNVFSLRVTEGAFDGWSGIPNANGSQRLRGEINPDGSAHIEGTGLTADNPEYTFGRGPPGQFFRYPVQATFTANRGMGTRMDATGTRIDEARPCELTFARED
jgi:hypothetical protein